jgi:DNA-binding NarL/FixJ family response regulator
VGRDRRVAHPDRVTALTETAAIQPIRILVVDDKPAVVEGLCRLFSKQKALAVVASASNGNDAIKELTLHKPDLVVMDLHMTERNGCEAAASMRRQFPAIRIIIMSIDEDAQVRRDCLQNGADSFLPKIGLQRTLMPEIKRLFPNRVY